MLNEVLKALNHRIAPAIVLLFYLLLYLIFPAGFSTTDGWNYAAEIRYTGDLFYPYHLLYNLLGFIFCYLPSGAGADILACLKIMNALFAALAVFFVYLLVLKTGRDRPLAIIVSCLAGASFSVMRYATENETYIVPLLLALIATFYFACFLRSGRSSHALISGFWSSMSVLFHLTYICWWAGLLAGFVMERKGRPVKMYLLGSLLIPLVYLVVILLDSGDLRFKTITRFMLSDFIDNSGFELTWKGLLFSGINLIRSFIQVHGYMYNMVKSSFLFVLPAIFSSLLMIIALFRFPPRLNSRSAFSNVLITILVLNLLMAVLSSGNAEFMVMIPVLSFALVAVLLINPYKFLLIILGGLLIWNISYGLVPRSTEQHLIEDHMAVIASEEKDVLIIASDDQLIKSMVYYNKGLKDCRSILKSPAVMKIRGEDPLIPGVAVDSALATGGRIYTDCIGPATISRSSISRGNMNELFFSRYVTEPVMTQSQLVSTKTVSRITGKSNR